MRALDAQLNSLISIDLERLTAILISEADIARALAQRARSEPRKRE